MSSPLYPCSCLSSFYLTSAHRARERERKRRRRVNHASGWSALEASLQSFAAVHPNSTQQQRSIHLPNSPSTCRVVSRFSGRPTACSPARLPSRLPGRPPVHLLGRGHHEYCRKKKINNERSVTFRPSQVESSEIGSLNLSLNRIALPHIFDISSPYRSELDF